MNEKDPGFLVGFIVLVVTAIICMMLGVENAFVATIIGIIAAGGAICFMESQKEKADKKTFESTGIIVLSEEAKANERKYLKESYEFACGEAEKDARSRYYINKALMSQIIDMGKGLALNDIKTGTEMQNSRGPQADWAIVGGLTSGLAGGAAGVAAALDTMKKNEEATKKYQEQGRVIAEQGRKSYERLEKNKSDILSTQYDDFLYSVPRKELIDKLKVEILDTENYGIGYIKATVKISANRDFIFPEGSGKKAAIDGTVRVDLYDKEGKVLMASGYYIPPNRFGNDISKTGFGTEDSKTIILKEELGVSFNKHNGYQVKLSHPNLWLLQL